MEFTQKDIAKLVLGYLKEQKFDKIFFDFLKRSPYLRRYYAAYHRKKKYIATRVCGLTLHNYLMEYAALYAIMEEKLEDTDFYSVIGWKRKSLVEQLLYLLEDKRVLSSRNTTPLSMDENIPFSRTSSRRESEDSSLNTCTLAEPSTDDVDVQLTPGKLNKSTCTTEDDVNLGNTSGSKDKCKIFKQTFLKNQDLIEKLADNINKEVTAKSLSSDDLVIPELDNDTIDSIICKISREPIIVNLLEEIIDTQREVNNCHETAPDIEKENLDEQNIQSTPKKVPSKCLSSIKKNLRLGKKSDHAAFSIDDQNNEAIQSIVAASNSSEKQQCSVDQSEIPVVNNNNQTDSVSEPYCDNNFINLNTPAGGSTSYQADAVEEMSVNQQNPPVILPKGAQLQYNIANPYCIVNGNQFLNIPQTSFKVNKALTEQDIMTMPTIIVCDNQQRGPNVVAAPTNSISKLRKIVPKKVETLSEYVTLYQCNEPFSPVITPVTVTKTPRIKTIPKAVKLKIKNKNKPKDVVKETITETSVVNTKKVESVVVESEKPELETNRKLLTQTTPLVVKVDCRESGSRSTPRNGSHVRQLDFSTPEKWGPSIRKANTSPKLDTATRNTGLPSIIAPKVIEVKTSLFQSSTDDVRNKGASETNKIVKSKVSVSWDADLRALAGPASVPVDEPVKNKKQKRKNSDSLEHVVGAKRAKDESGEKKMEPTEQNNLVAGKEEEDGSAKRKRRQRVPSKKSNVVEKTTKEKEANSNTVEEIVVPPVVVAENDKKNEHKVGTRRSKRKSNENIEESSEKTAHTEDVFLSNITKIASCNVIIPDGQDVEGIDGKLESSLPPSGLKFPILETPGKFDSIAFPKTPGIFTSPTIDTPFTKSVIAQLDEVDINSFPTPKFPITPNFSLTPAVNEKTSPFPNRPTDYSTTSSYYQPSDTEQDSGKSIGRLIEECHRLENQENIVVIAPPDQPHVEDETDQVDPVQSLDSTTKAFNASLVGKKNLHLLNTEVEDENTSSISINSSSSSSKSTDTSSCSDYTSMESGDSSYQNRHVVQNKEQTISYSLRSRSVSTPTVIVNKSKPKERPVRNVKESLLKEMEEKRQRTIARFKDSSLPSKTTKPTNAKTPSKMTTKKLQNTSNNRKTGITRVKNKNTSPRNTIKKHIKTKSANSSNNSISKNIVGSSPKLNPVKSVKPKEPLVKKQDDDKVLFHLSSDDDNVKPYEMVETELLEGSSSSVVNLEADEKTAGDAEEKQQICDREASLVKGLKQWGIHLVPNKKQSTPPLSPTIHPKVEKKTNQNQAKIMEKSIDTSINIVEFDVNLNPGVTYKLTHDYSTEAISNAADYNFNILRKKMSASVYIAETDLEYERILSVTPFECLLDIEAVETPRKKVNIVSNQLIKGPDYPDSNLPPNNDESRISNLEESEANLTLNDDLMNYAIVGSERIEDTECAEIEDLKVGKRKEEGDPKKKKKQTNQQCQELLKTIDVDSFLKQLHGEDC